MKKILILIVSSSFFTTLMASEETNSTQINSIEKESALRLVPLITSSPLLGAGLGGAASYLYDTGDGSSSKSQTRIGGQYSNTESYNIFANNNAYFHNNSIISTTVSSFSHINNEFQAEGEDIEYNLRTLFISTQLIYRMKEDIYAGAYISYRDQKYDPSNKAGEDFIFDNGITDQKSAGFGVVASYDTRKNKYYPSNAAWVSVRLTSNPSWLGADDQHYVAMLNARYYAQGYNEEDVWAWQFYGEYSSEKTPDAALPTLSGKSLLRGFPSGQFRARYLNGMQSEYRYKIPHSKYKLVAFYGVANLNGGSYGEEGRSRQDNGWYSAGGIGARYAIQAQTGVDLRLDLVTTSTNEQALYLMLNQSF